MEEGLVVPDDGIERRGRRQVPDDSVEYLAEYKPFDTASWSVDLARRVGSPCIAVNVNEYYPGVLYIDLRELEQIVSLLKDPKLLEDFVDRQKREEEEYERKRAAGPAWIKTETGIVENRPRVKGLQIVEIPQDAESKGLTVIKTQPSGEDKDKPVKRRS